MSDIIQRYRIFLATLALAVTVLVLFFPASGHEFITLDDTDYILWNPFVSQGITWEGVGWAFSALRSSNWHPLTWLSHMLDVTYFGMDAGWHHLVSILIHTLNTVLLFLALFRMTGAFWRSITVAALFGLHPLHVESVAWVAERKDVLSGFFFMLVLLSYNRYIRHGGVGRYLLVAILFALGLMAKPMLVTVPFVLLLLDVWPLGRTPLAPPVDGSDRKSVPWRHLFLEKSPLLALTLGSCVVTYIAQQRGDAISGVESLSFGLRMSNALVSYVAYLGKTFWTSSLAVYYPHSFANLPWWQTAGSSLILIIVTLAVLLRLGRPYLAVGWFWFLGMLIPVIGIVQVGSQAMADRYTYLPLIGLFTAAVWLLTDTAPAKLPHRAKILGVFAIAILTALSVGSRSQVGYWKNSLTLYNHALSVTSDNWLIHYNLGLVLDKEGRSEDAIAHFREALRINPDHAEAHNNLGVALEKLGRTDKAVTHYTEALRLRPNYALAHNNLGVSLKKMGRMGEAVTHFREALRIQPDFAFAHYNIADSLARMGRMDEAIAHFREAQRLNPEIH
jgi:tetratricopeptide (TPR) repeat protein